MKPARIVVLCVAAAAAVGLALVVRTMGSGGDAVSTASAAPAPAVATAKVLVAAKDLAPGMRLGEGDITWRDWPVDLLNPAYITDGSVPVPGAEAEEAAPEQVDKPEGAVAAVQRRAAEIAGPAAEADFFGATVREPITAGEPILARKIVRANESGYLAASLEPGMRAMAIRVTVETAAGGFILPGDRVDVVLTREVTLSNLGEVAQSSKFASNIVMQNVKVLAIDQAVQAGDELAVVGATATLEVRPGDAEALALAKSEGELSLVLRSYADTAGPSGRVAPPRPAASRAVRVFRGGAAAETVVVQ